MAKKRIVLLCPEPLSQGFKFVRECPISSCKNWTNLVSSKCLAIQRSTLLDGEVLSVAEAAHFKGVTTDDAELALLEAGYRVKALTLFDQYWTFCAAQKDSSEESNTSEEATVYLGEWLTLYPMAIGRWNVSSFSTIKRLFSPDYFQAFADSSSFCADVYEMGQYAILHVNKPRYNQICSELGIEL